MAALPYGLPVVNGHALVGGNVSNPNIGSPLTMPRPIAAASKDIRLYDPITTSSGLISRGDETSTALYGFAAEPSIRTEPAQIPTMPNNVDASGRTVISSFVADINNEFIGAIGQLVALTQAMVDQICDIGVYLAPVTPVLTTGGSAGSTTRNYQVCARSLMGTSNKQSLTALTTGNATLSATNYDIITIPDTPGAISFDIYLGAFFLKNVPANPGNSVVYNNTGADTVTTTAPPAQNDSGWVVNTAGSSTNVLHIVGLIDPVGTLGGRVRFKIPMGKSQYLVT